jgi:hypothetical protein
MSGEPTFIRGYDKYSVMVTETIHWTPSSAYVEIEAYKERMCDGEIAFIEVIWPRMGMQTIYAHEVEQRGKQKH